MEAKKIIIYTASDPCWDELAELWQEMELDEFVEHITNEVPDAVLSDPYDDDVDGDIMDENDHYILTVDDGMDEMVCIYEKSVKS